MDIINSIFSLSQFDTFEKKQSAQIQYTVLAIYIVASFIYLLIESFVDVYRPVSWDRFFLLRIILFSILFILVRKGFLKASSYFILFFLTSSLLLSVLVSGSVISPGYASFIVVIIASTTLFGKRAGYFMLGLMMLLGFSLTILEVNGLITGNVARSPLLWFMALSINFTLALLLTNQSQRFIQEALADSRTYATSLEKEQRALLKLNKLYQTLIACNKNPFEAKDREALLQSVCQTIVEVGKYDFAWVKLWKDDEILSVHHGRLPTFQPTTVPESFLEGMETAVATQQTQLTTSESSMCTFVSLPFRQKGGEFQGVLNICSKQGHWIEFDESQLFETLAKDLVYNVWALETQAALVESEKKFAKVFEVNPTAMTIVRQSDLTFVDVNHQFVALTGTPREKVIGKTITNMAHFLGDSAHRLAEIFRSPDDIWNFELNITARSGLDLYIDYSSTLIDISGETHRLNTAVDITEHMKAQKELEHQAFVLQNVSDAVLSTDNDFNITSWNKGAESIYGWTAEEAIGRPSTEILRTAFSDEDRTNAFRALQENGHWQNTVIQQHKDGTPRTILATISLLRNNQNQAIGTVGINRDITDQVKTQHNLDQRNRELLALLQLSGILTHRLSKQQLFEKACHLIIQTLPNAEGATIWVYDFTVDKFRVAAWSGHDKKEVDGLCASKQTSLVGKVYRKKKPVIVNDTVGDKAFKRIKKKQMDKVLALVGVPIMINGAPVALLFADNFTQKNSFRESDLRWLSSLGNQLAILLENSRLFEGMHKAQEELRHLANRVQATLEDERKRISRQIHDEFGQLLTGLNIDLALLKAGLADEEGNGRLTHQFNRLDHMEILINDAIQLARDIAAQLRPSILDDLGLAEAIEWQIAQTANPLNITYDIIIHPRPFIQLPENVTITLYRIFKEALTNIIRHANATHIVVTLQQTEETINLQIEDNGSGIDDSNNSELGLGLVGIRERTDNMGGSFILTSTEQQGTILTIRVPLKELDEATYETITHR